MSEYIKCCGQVPSVKERASKDAFEIVVKCEKCRAYLCKLGYVEDKANLKQMSINEWNESEKKYVVPYVIKSKVRVGL